MIIAINFSDEKYRDAQSLNSKTAIKYGADKVIEYTPKDIDLEYKKKNENHLKYKRGYGYWFWKPYIISKTLEKINDGDFVIYTDSGAAYINDIKIFINIMNRDNIDIMCFCINQIEKNWTKRDAFILLDSDIKEYTDTNQICTGYIVIRKNNKSINVIKEYMNAVMDLRIVSDEDNVLGHDNYDGFVENRHDQSAWSLICKKHGIKPYRDPSEFGIKDNVNMDVFPKDVLERSTYPQMIESHRNANIKYFFELNIATKWYQKIEKMVYNKIKRIIK